MKTLTTRIEIMNDYHIWQKFHFRGQTNEWMKYMNKLLCINSINIPETIDCIHLVLHNKSLKSTMRRTWQRWKVSTTSKWYGDEKTRLILGKTTQEEGKEHSNLQNQTLINAYFNAAYVHRMWNNETLKFALKSKNYCFFLSMRQNWILK